MRRFLSSALPFASITVGVFIVLNLLAGLALTALLLVTPNRDWTITALGLAGVPDKNALIWGLRGIIVLGIAAVILTHQILSRLFDMLSTVEAGDPFVIANAYRLQSVAWFLLCLQLVSLAIAGLGALISTPAHPIDLDSGFSPAGWLAVLLTFVLARVFAEGAGMRRELEGTV